TPLSTYASYHVLALINQELDLSSKPNRSRNSARPIRRPRSASATPGFASIWHPTRVRFSPDSGGGWASAARRARASLPSVADKLELDRGLEGSSLGFVPLRMRSTYAAARRGCGRRNRRPRK